MAPKIKLHNKNGKVKSFPSKVVVPAPEPAGPSAAPEPAPAERQFELELCWCIQQLEVSLLDKKINPKQTQASMQILRVLKNNTQPIVRKRQLMRTHFGDYRAKMAAEEKKAKKVNEQISFTKTSPSTSKSTFLRKSAVAMGDNTFRFNFEATKDADAADIKNESVTETPVISDDINTNRDDVDDAKTNPSKFHFTSGDFKFNFILDNNMV